RIENNCHKLNLFEEVSPGPNKHNKPSYFCTLSKVSLARRKCYMEMLIGKEHLSAILSDIRYTHLGTPESYIELARPCMFTTEDVPCKLIIIHIPHARLHCMILRYYSY
ncbi:23850_t:CDS:2, partial [Gigaspora rosea]